MLYRFLICCALLISSYATPLYASDDFDIDIEYTLEDPIPTDEYETIERQEDIRLHITINVLFLNRYVEKLKA